MARRVIVRVGFEQTPRGKRIVLYSRSDRGTIFRVDEHVIERGDSSAEEMRARVAEALLPGLTLLKSV